MKMSTLVSKRFRGVGEQRKTEEQDFWCFVHAKNGVRVTLPEQKMSESQKEIEVEGRKHLQTNPWIFKTTVRQQTELVIG